MLVLSVLIFLMLSNSSIFLSLIYLELVMLLGLTYIITMTLNMAFIIALFTFVVLEGVIGLMCFVTILKSQGNSFLKIQSALAY